MADEQLADAVGAMQISQPVAAAAASSSTSSTSQKSQKKVRHLVVDSGAIIKGTDLSALAEVRACASPAVYCCYYGEPLC